MPRKSRPRACVHLDRRIYALGLCQPCYSARYLQENYDRHLELGKLSRDRLRVADPERVRLLHREAWLRQMYSLTMDQFNSLWQAQEGLCAICRSELGKGRNTHVDHDHLSQRVRGLLCANCNKALGLFGDNLELLEAAVAYMKKASRRIRAVS